MGGGLEVMTNKFTAIYEINKYQDGDVDFGNELLELFVLFEHPCEEDNTIGEYTDAYDYVVHDILKDYSCGTYRIFVSGYLTYSTDYYGESDVEGEIEYHSVFTYTPEMADEIYGEQ